MSQDIRLSPSRESKRTTTTMLRLLESYRGSHSFLLLTERKRRRSDLAVLTDKKKNALLLGRKMVDSPCLTAARQSSFENAACSVWMVSGIAFKINIHSSLTFHIYNYGLHRFLFESCGDGSECGYDSCHGRWSPPHLEASTVFE